MTPRKPGSKVTFGPRRGQSGHQGKQGGMSRSRPLGKSYKQISENKEEAGLESLIPSEKTIVKQPAIQFRMGQIWQTKVFHPTIANFFTVSLLKESAAVADKVMVINDHPPFTISIGQEDFTFVRVAPLHNKIKYYDEDVGDLICADPQVEEALGGMTMIMLSLASWVLSDSLDVFITESEIEEDELSVIEMTPDYQREIAEILVGENFMHLPSVNDALQFRKEIFQTLEYLRRPAELVNFALFWQHYRVQLSLNLHLTSLTVSVNKEGEYILSCNNGDGGINELPLSYLLGRTLDHHKRELKNLMDMKL